MTRAFHNQRFTAGFTLVEVLVALTVLSIGLLGVAKMSLSTVQSNGSSFMRTQAIELVQEVVDDMRANQPQAAAGGYNIALGASPGAAANCDTGACTAAQIATFDLAQWVTQLSTLLPSGKGSVAVVAGANPVTGNLENQAVVTVTWDDTVAQMAFANGTAPATTTQSVITETLL